ncbi:MAG: CCA tRNA nucleotidyltransferase [bacterium]|nr:CCA tRNA nucleotidyltransferase [bacterium]MDY4101246.1 CCA tRNA nucleotidyltransferase [Lachnospiraceae bacterium]
MNIRLPEHVKFILGRLEENGFEGYAVGGCVRDALLGRVPQDWDITTNAKPLQVKELFRRTIDTGLQHGTVTIMLDHTGYEVTTYRIDGEYEDGRHPKAVSFTGSLSDDLMRRDFTINAMAYNETEGLVDLFGGRADLEQGVIRCVGEPKERFTEDALRMMRAIRFSAQLGFSIEERTLAAIRELAPSIRRISAERIQTELIKTLVSAHPQTVRRFYETGLSSHFLPELDRMMETAQKNPHHCYSVGEHTLHSLDEVPPEKVLRLAMLLHDVAKPLCKTTDEAGIDHFHGHPAKGAEIAKQILRRLKLDNETITRVTQLIRWHDDNPPLTERNVRRAICRVGTAQYPDIFAVKRADILAQSDYQKEEKLQYVDDYEKVYRQILEKNQCLCIKDLAVDGSDLLAAGIPQGKAIGEKLHELLELVLEQPECNTREDLLTRITGPAKDGQPKQE